VKRVAYVLGLAGLAAAIALVARAGWHSVLDALAAAGWPLLWLVPLRVVPIGLDALGWRVLLAPRDPQGRASWSVLLPVAIVREAVNRLLPVAGVGGELVGIRIVIRRGLEPASVAASVIAEVVLTLLNLVLFAALGLALLVASARGTGSLDSIFIGVLLALPIPLAGLWLISEGRLVAWLQRLAALVTGSARQAPAWIQSMPSFEAELSALARRRGRLALAALCQLAGMIAGVSEVWLALRLLGAPGRFYCGADHRKRRAVRAQPGFRDSGRPGRTGGRDRADLRGRWPGPGGGDRAGAGQAHAGGAVRPAGAARLAFVGEPARPAADRRRFRITRGRRPCSLR